MLKQVCEGSRGNCLLLSWCRDNMTKILDDFLPEVLIDEILADNDRFMDDETKWWSSHQMWVPEIVKSSAPVFARPLPGQQTIKVYAQLLERNLIKPNDPVPTVLAYVWHPLSFIPWHDDNHQRYSATIYLNREWDPNWGGYLLWREGDTMHVTPPCYNRIFFSTGKVEHSTTMTTRDAGLRQTVQVFLAR